MKYKIKCRFCGKKTGEIEIKDNQIKEGEVINDQTLGISDARCSDCESEHGGYKEMEDIYRQEIGGTSDEFKEMIKLADYKKGNFKSLITEKKAQMIADIEAKIEEEKNAEKIPSENL